MCAGERLKLPQSVDPQLALQLTPLVLLEGETEAASAIAEPVFIVAGSDAVVDSVIAIGVDETTFATAAAVFVGSAVDFAVMVIVPLTGTFELLVKVAATPLDVWVVMLPQFDVLLLQFRLQSTPAPEESFDTIAVSRAERFCPVC